MKLEKILEDDYMTMTDEEYVLHKIDYNKKLFNWDRGNKNEKKDTLGDIQSTKIQIPEILKYPSYDYN